LLFQHVASTTVQQGKPKKASIKMKSLHPADGARILMHDLLRKPSFQDFELVSSNGKVFKCHKNILAG